MAEDDGPLPSLPEGALAFLLGQTGTFGDDPSVAPVTQQQLNDQVSLLQTALSEKIDSSEFDTRVQPFISNWLTTYLNANPNSWVNLRTLLQYYPLTYSAWTNPTREWVARPGESNGRTWKLITTAANNWNFPYLHSGTTTSQTDSAATTSRPFGFFKPTNQDIYYGINTSGHGTWSNRGTFFLVYTWTVAPVADRILVNSLDNVTGGGTTLIVNTGPRCRWTRNNFVITLEAGGTATYPGPPASDTEIGVPYIAGFSWDFTVNPPRFCWVGHRYAIEHLGPNEPTELLEITESGLIPTPTTSWDLPYTAYHASESRLASVRLWSTGQSGTALIQHYFAQWSGQYMGMEEARTVHMRLMQRYCVPPFDDTNPRLQDDIPDPEPV